MMGKVKRVEILKNEAQSHAEYFDKTSCFELQLLFPVGPEVFFQTLRQYSGSLGGALNLAYCVRKKLESYNTSIKIY